MTATTRFKTLAHESALVGLAGLAMMLTACGVEQDEAAGATGALEAAPVVEAPVVIDTARVDRADEALRTALAAIDDPEARFAARLEQFRLAQDDVLRDGELDRRSAAETSAAIRERLLGTEEAQRDGEAAIRARSERAALVATAPVDLASVERARAIIERRAGARPPVPMELRTPEGVSTATRPPTAAELRHGTR